MPANKMNFDKLWSMLMSSMPMRYVNSISPLSHTIILYFCESLVCLEDFSLTLKVIQQRVDEEGGREVSTKPSGPKYTMESLKPLVEALGSEENEAEDHATIRKFIKFVVAPLYVLGDIAVFDNGLLCVFMYLPCKCVLV